MKLKDKIKEIRKKSGLTQIELAEKLGINRGTVINWEKGFSSPDIKELKILSEVFDTDFTMLHVERNETDNDETLIPFFDAIAVGGMALLADQTPVEMPSQMIDPGSFLRTATGSLRIYGHSMFPKYPAGCIVAFKSADLDVIIWGEDYVIELEDRRIIKRIDKGEVTDCVKAVSYNKSEDYVYAPIDIPKKKIKRLYMVLGKIELEASI